MCAFHCLCQGCRGHLAVHGPSHTQKWSVQYLHFGINAPLCRYQGALFLLQVLWSMFCIFGNNTHNMAFRSFLITLHGWMFMIRMLGTFFIAYGPRAGKWGIEFTKEHYWSRSSGNVCSQVRQNSCSSPLSVTLTSTLPHERHIFEFMKNPPWLFRELRCILRLVYLAHRLAFRFLWLSSDSLCRCHRSWLVLLFDVA